MSASTETIRDPLLLAAARRTDDHLYRERYRGYDPYDALMSPIFRRGPLARAKIPRWGFQQALKRLPVNVRPLLRIPKGYNPVTLALALQGYAHLVRADPAGADRYSDRARFCVDELRRLRSPGWSGDCWGYDFDWEARYARIPAGMPTIVATGFVTNALFTAHGAFGWEDCFAMCERACEFVQRDLPRIDQPDGTFCWGYSPHGTDVVLNATLKGARLLGQVHSQTGAATLLETAARTVEFAARQQRADGSWPYALGDTRSWADNFHTGYVLDCLRDYSRLTGDRRFDTVTSTGYDYYRTTFFEQGVIPKYYNDRTYPIDATACAQSVITLAGFGDFEHARAVARWCVDRLALPDGAFAYRIHRRYANRIPYVRWSTGWMFAALGRLLDSSPRT